ncbi:pantoate--beta-alanine ligase [Salegentibacter holothuriorum]|uniref:Pantothenate synthetase n=1 Tax=Salegentibacter holothuriorum TaxID=241145 RepID=A0A1T5BMC7_9FLAO|nr:pantoate--beta-alanine ligase [Salegentibacter holothuriorum]SKB48150.1 pantoate--beta-alanine ligase [Salegentibacter holothuriorum]
MQVFKEKTPLKAAIRTAKSKEKTIGLVPTMGALHEGHLSLVKQALQACDQVIVSIFVNPTQFDNAEDLEKYPRTLEEDIRLLKEAGSKLWVFAPTANELYGKNISSEQFHFDGLEQVMEGKHRNGHFDGVGTIVKRLFEVITPHKAFFGEKDFQQLQIVRKLIEKTGLPVQIVGCPILREDNGLARSSRNERLNTIEREKASFIYQTLLKAKELFGTKSAEYIHNWVQEQFDSHPILKLEYFEIANTQTLEKINRKRKGNTYRAFIAAYAGDVRLIDNIALNNEE